MRLHFFEISFYTDQQFGVKLHNFQKLTSNLDRKVCILTYWELDAEATQEKETKVLVRDNQKPRI